MTISGFPGQRFVLGIAALIGVLALTAPAHATTSDRDAALYGHFRDFDSRLAAVSYRLATSNAGLCDEKTAATGLTLSDLATYPADARRAAATAYSLAAGQSPLFVNAVVEGSPAWLAGLRVGHRVTALDGGRLAPLGPPTGYDRMGAIDAAMAEWLSDGELAVSVEGAAAPLAITGVPACASIFQVKASNTIGAAADGRYVQVNAAMFPFAARDEELAVVIAHELSHNILKHREWLDAADIDRGLLQNFGRNATLTRQTELEADRFATWLLAGAGYDPAAAIDFWERWRREHGDGLIASGTHGRSSTRIKAMKDEIAAMQAARAADPNARPGWMGR